MSSTYFPALSLLQTGFEGCEKRLFIYFDRIKYIAMEDNQNNNDNDNGNDNHNHNVTDNESENSSDDKKAIMNQSMRDISYETWVEILKNAKCSILNTVTNDYCTAYLLSESSLFVYDEKIMIKTCGTTTLLLMLPSLLIECEKRNLFIKHLTFSRSNFMFPSNQPEIHQSFQSEVSYLNKYFKDGNALVLGPLNCARWHCYSVGQLNINNDKNCLEIVMFDLDTNVMKVFFKKYLESKQFYLKDPSKNKEYQIKVTNYLLEKIGLFTLFKNVFQINDNDIHDMIIDGYIFHPCGFSLNLLYNDKYVTIHITPESEASFVSFEIFNIPNVKNQQYLIQNILNIFKPQRFSIAVTHYKTNNYFNINSYLSHFDSNYYDSYNNKYYYSLKNHSSHVFSQKPFYTIASGNWCLVKDERKKPALDFGESVINNNINQVNNDSDNGSDNGNGNDNNIGNHSNFNLYSNLLLEKPKYQQTTQLNNNVDLLLSLTMNALKELEEMREMMKDHSIKKDVESKIKNMRQTLLDMCSVHCQNEQSEEQQTEEKF